MNESIFFRLLKEEDKETNLRCCVNDLHGGEDTELTFTVRQETFALLPASPMPYWVSDAIRRKFKELPSFEGGDGHVQRGLYTTDDFRFVRIVWEVPPHSIGLSKHWALFSKGGEYNPYYADIHLLVNREDNFREIRTEALRKYPYLKGNTDWVLHPECWYGEPGLTYPLRTTSRFGPRILPRGCFWSNKGISIFPNNLQHGFEFSWSHLAIFNSRVVLILIEMLVAAGDAAARSYEQGLVASLPFPRLSASDRKNLADFAKICHNLKRDLDRINEISHVFTQPALLGVSFVHLEATDNNLEPLPQNLEQRFLTWLAVQEAAEVKIVENSYQIDQMVLDLYEISRHDRRTIDRELGPHPGSYPYRDEWSDADDDKLRLLYLTKELLPNEIANQENDAEDGDEEDTDGQPTMDSGRPTRRTTYRSLEEIAHALQVHPASVAARRQALGLYRLDDFTQAVADLISYCIGCLFGRWDIRIGAGVLEPPPLPDPEEGLPLYAPAALRPDSPPLKPAGLLAQVVERSAKHGILVDDSGHSHDLAAGIEACLAYLFGEDCLPSLRAEIAAALDREMRPWLANSFFSLHLKRYSKSRRKAPVYWQLATPSRSYSLWLYYHALKSDTLYTAIREYVTPKIEFEERRLKEIQAQAAQASASGPAREARRLEKAVDDQEAFLQELYAFRSELQRLADWGFNPDLNDGVIINIAPLHRLVPRPEARKMWQALERGQYEWSVLAQKTNRKEGSP